MASSPTLNRYDQPLSPEQLAAVLRRPVNPCVVHYCPRDRLPGKQGRLCQSCEARWTKGQIPYAGFLASDTALKVAREIIKQASPTASEIGEAERYVRGPLYPRGDWEDRPAFRMTPLKHGSAARRREQLLIGRRFNPRLPSIIAGLVQKIILEDLEGVGHDPYTRPIVGMQYLGQRGMVCPKGKSPDLGPATHKVYRLSNKDFSLLGTVVLKAAAKAGFRHDDPRLRLQIVQTYAKGLAEERYKPVLFPPAGSIRTAMPNDHPFRLYHAGTRHWVPRECHGKASSSTGTVDGVFYPDLWDRAGKADENRAKRRQQMQDAAAKRYARLTKHINPATRPDPGWLFNSTT